MKKDLRKELLNKRKNITNKDYLDFLIVEKLQGLIKDFHNIMIYYPIHKEPNILLLKKLVNDKNYYLPYCINEEDMEYRKYENDNFIKDECSVNSSNIKTNEKIDVVIAPCIGANRLGYRLGFGKGYYDRFLKKYPNILKIGITYSDMLVDLMFQDEWDVKFDLIVTEKEIIEVK